MHADDVIIGETTSSVTQKTRQCRVWEAAEALADVLSPVFIQILPQVPDSFWEAHFQFEGVVPIFWLDLQGDEVRTGGTYPVMCFHHI